MEQFSPSPLAGEGRVGGIIFNKPAMRANIFLFFKFNLVGVLNTLADYGVFTLLHLVLRVHYGPAHAFSYLCGVANSYLWNKHWTFQQRGRVTGLEVSRFLAVNAVSLGVSWAVLYTCREWLLLPVLAGKAVATVAAMLVNFAGNRFWVFHPQGSDR